MDVYWKGIRIKNQDVTVTLAITNTALYSPSSSYLLTPVHPWRNWRNDALFCFSFLGSQWPWSCDKLPVNHYRTSLLSTKICVQNHNGSVVICNHISFLGKSGSRRRLLMHIYPYLSRFYSPATTELDQQLPAARLYCHRGWFKVACPPCLCGPQSPSIKAARGWVVLGTIRRDLGMKREGGHSGEAILVTVLRVLWILLQASVSYHTITYLGVFLRTFTT